MGRRVVELAHVSIGRTKRYGRGKCPQWREDSHGAASIAQAEMLVSRREVGK
jgi:hypothetical protein